MATLTVTATFDYSSTLLSNIDIIEFTAAADATFAAAQFDNIQILDGVSFAGNGNVNNVIITGGTIDASGWAVTGWSNSADSFTFLGTTGNDTITGAKNRSIINGDAGKDTLKGGKADDTISGGTGQDSIIGGKGADAMVGDGGNDTFKYKSVDDVVDGESIDGGGGTGDKILLDGVSSYTMFTGVSITGIEKLKFASATTAVFNGDIFGSGGITEVTSSASSDYLYINGPDIDLSNVTFVDWGAGGFTDYIYLVGLEDTDTLTGSTMGEWLYGNGGDDVLRGKEGSDNISGGLGADDIACGGDNDNLILFGGEAVDPLDIFKGDGGYDSINVFGSTTGDVYDFSQAQVSGFEQFNINATVGTVADTTVILDASDVGAGQIARFLINTATDLQITGGDIDMSAVTFGFDAVPDPLALTLTGDNTGNTLTGTAYGDTINGLNGGDDIMGGLGRDILTGGTGADSFIYTNVNEIEPTADGRDTITDFVQGDDVIDMRQAVGWTFIGSSATFNGNGDAEVRFTQSGNTTFIFFDEDGNGTSDGRIDLTGLFTLTAGDFILA